ncbi:uncharacterized protein EDB91DRAFT_1081826 [Suillus paluster]|uniref:uncharacterized protein n=1 Tax=Suillus paluster TaxID=48578 RepID=UPI001B86E945|nr:uncharacterized protein EDB91DRAFT_1081826 [Suillus paluster]KAG1741567.1 hypothetical protein EDB91DRAFT_1081826 [Suillus paluster]
MGLEGDRGCQTRMGLQVVVHICSMLQKDKSGVDTTRLNTYLLGHRGTELRHKVATKPQALEEEGSEKQQVQMCAHHGPTWMFKKAGHDVVDDHVLSRGYWEALQEHPGGSKIIFGVRDGSLSLRLLLKGLKHSTTAYIQAQSVLDVGHPWPPADLRMYMCAAMRVFNPVPYEELQFVFGATEASSSAAEGGRSTPPTEYTPELETSELPYFAVDPTLLDNGHDPTSKKRKRDSLSSELEDHNMNMPTLTGTHGRAGHPPTRHFQSPFLPASEKICTSNQKTSNVNCY